MTKDGRGERIMSMRTLSEVSAGNWYAEDKVDVDSNDWICEGWRKVIK